MPRWQGLDGTGSLIMVKALNITDVLVYPVLPKLNEFLAPCIRHSQMLRYGFVLQ
jgi:hypothetical protein